MSRFLNIKLSLAIKSVLGGLIPGLITPARMGEWLGRGYFLEKDQRKQATTVAAYAGFIKTMALVLWGSIALLWLNVSPFVSSSKLLDKILNPLIMALVIFIILFVLSKRIAQKLFSLPMIRKRVHKDLQNFHWLDTRYRLISISIASLRLIIFYTQFYFMLLGFGIAPESLALLSLIPIYFMILTFLPVFSIGEPGLRGSVAILLFAPFIENSVLVGIAGMLLWMINNISPMILGSYFWIKKS